MRRVNSWRGSLSPLKISRRFVHTKLERNDTVPFRDFIHQHLYGPEGYFTKNAPVRKLIDPIPFETLKSEAEYREALINNMEKKAGWSTPVEIFRPYYAHNLGNYVAQMHDHSKPLRIYEIGGGNGTCAEGFMDFLLHAHPKLYEKTQYTIVDISLPLHEVQQNLLRTHPQVRLVHSSFFEFEERCDDPCFVIALEVLDNLPHDKVVIKKKEVKEVRVAVGIPAENSAEHSREETFPVEDPYIREFCDMLKVLYPSAPPPLHYPLTFLERIKVIMGGVGKLGMEYYLPTSSLRLLSQLCENFPQHRLLVADFVSLPFALPGVNGPRVQSEWHRSTYLSAPMGTVDIFFPTDFSLLRDMTRYCQWRHFGDSRESSILTPREFFFRYGVSNVKSSSGEVLRATPLLSLSRDSPTRFFVPEYNPFLNDFLNTRFFLT